MKKTKIGIIGCGNISNAYFNAAKRFDIIEVVACADINADAAKAKAEEHGVKALTVDKLLADKSIEIVINLTVPKAHFEITTKILQAGKHAYGEKPFALTVAEANKINKLAKEKNLRVGCAPDTFLGGGLQTCRKLIDDGWIGKVLSGTAFMLGAGPEKWHPNPKFFYEYGGGPMLDMGPYYITALVHLLGPVKSVTAVTGRGFAERISGPGTGRMHIPVEVVTHNAGVLEFQSGAIITVTISFDVQRHGHSPIELYGSEGSLQVPDPNTFGGPVKVFRCGYENWVEAPLSHIYTQNSRSIGAVDMAYAIQSGRKHRASGELAAHVLEVMLAFEESGKAGAKVAIKNKCTQPAPLPVGLEEGLLDA